MSAISRLNSKERLSEDYDIRTWQQPEDEEDVRFGNKKSKGLRQLLALVFASIVTAVFSVCIINESYNRAVKRMSPERQNSFWQGDILWTPCGDNIECGRLECVHQLLEVHIIEYPLEFL